MVERRLEQAAEEGEAGMLDRLRFLPVRWLIPPLSFPLCGNDLHTPLDSSAACSRRGSTTCIHAGEPSLE